MNPYHPFPVPPKTLGDLLDGGYRYADYHLRRGEPARPAFWVIADNGHLGALFFQNGEFNEADRDNFAQTCRFFAMATNAVAAAFTLEVWMSFGRIPAGADPSTFQPETMPSDDPARREVIMLTGEDKNSRQSRAHEIIRYDNGKYHGMSPTLETFNSGGRLVRDRPFSPHPPARHGAPGSSSHGRRMAVHDWREHQESHVQKMKGEILPQVDTTGLDRLLLQPDGRMRLYPAAALQDIPLPALRLWCHRHARYGLPTFELIDWLAARIGDKPAIEVGAGAGDLGFRLGIPMTDSYQQQDDPQTVAIMAMAGQPGTKPLPDVHKEDAQSAVIRCQPDVVVASWLTQRWLATEPAGAGNMHGPREEVILANCATYIHIGNENIHGQKRILARPHETYHFPWLVSRATEQAKNVIYVWHN